MLSFDNSNIYGRAFQLLSLAGDPAASGASSSSEAVPPDTSGVDPNEFQEQPRHRLILHHKHVLTTTSSRPPSVTATVGRSVRGSGTPAWRDVERRTSGTACNVSSRNKPAGET